MPSEVFPVRAAERTHLYWIDWLRFLAAMLVLLDHACEGNWAGPEPAVAPANETLLKFLVFPIHLGREAVVVFFVLSGALVGGLSLEKFRSGTFDLRSYASDRITRLYVPLLPALLLSLAVMRVFEFPADPWQLADCLPGLQGVVMRVPAINSPLWSLAYEMWFYVLAGCVAVAAARQRSPASGRLAALVGVALSLWILCFKLEWVYLACWLVGAGGFGLRHRLGKGAHPWLAATGFFLMIAGTAGLRPDMLSRVSGLATVDQWSWLRLPAHLTLAGGTVLWAVSVCRLAPQTRVGKGLERVGTTLAAFSYTLYLTHFPMVAVLIWTFGVMPAVFTWHSLVRLGGWMALCLAVAAVMYALFERQTPRARRWLRARFGGGAARAETPPGRLPLAIEA